MEKNNAENVGFSFTQEQIRRVLGSEEGKKLIRLLSGRMGNAWIQAAAAVKNGDPESAKRMMEPWMHDPEVQKLLDAINRK